MNIAKWKRWGAGAGSLLGLLVIVALLALGNFGGALHPAQAQTTTPTATSTGNNSRLITVNAIGKVQAAPDVAYLNVGSIVQALTAREALDKATAAAEQIRQALVDAGIPAQSIQTQGINTYPVQAPEKEGQPPAEPTGYRASINLNVTINDLSKAGTALDAATKAGANQVGGLNYAIKDDSSLRAQALEQAVKQAQPKADAIARGLGLQVGQVVTVAEDPNGYYGGPVNAVGKGDGLSPGELTVSVQVKVSYAIQ